MVIQIILFILTFMYLLCYAMFRILKTFKLFLNFYLNCNQFLNAIFEALLLKGWRTRTVITKKLLFLCFHESVGDR